MYRSDRIAVHWRKKNLLIGAVIGCVAGIFLSLLLWNNWLLSSRRAVSDFLYATGGEIDTSRIVMVVIDDRSLKELGFWQGWPRRYHAELIDKLHQAGARVIGFDLLFSEPDPDDLILAGAMTDAGSVVSPLLGIEDDSRVFAPGELISYPEFLKPQPGLAGASSVLGHTNACSNHDGVVRCFPAVIRNEEDGQITPAFALAVVSDYLRLPDIDYLPQAGYIYLADRPIPVDEFGQVLINYAGPPSQPGKPSTFKVLSYIDILNDDFDKADVEGKIVLIGVMASGIGDGYITPVSKDKMVGVEVWANVIEMILNRRFLQETPLLWQIGILMGISIVSSVAFMKLRPLKSAIALLLFLIIYWFVVVFAFDQGLLLDLFYPSLAVVLVYIAGMIYYYTFELSRQRRIVGVLEQYVSSDIASIILKSLETGELNPEGISREATVLFADIRNYVGLAERLSPVETMSRFNEYMETIIAIVDKHHGTTISFIGDGILAVWNLPLAQTLHALRAVRAAIEMREVVGSRVSSDQREENEVSGPVEIAIGINTGHIVAGNVGSKTRRKYTVMGDSVNVARYLCDSAKKNEILIGSRTQSLISGYQETESREPLTLRQNGQNLEVYAVKYTNNSSEAVQPDIHRVMT